MLLASCATLPAPAPSPGRSSSADSAATTAAAGQSLPAREPEIEVGLAWDLETLTLAPAGAAQLRGSPAHRIRAGEALTARSVPGGFEVAWRSGTRRELARLGARDTAWLVPERRDEFVTWNGKSWRGELKLFLSPRGKLTLASRLPLESYLLGVIPGEIGGLTDQVFEAGRSQAIAARSYTLFYRGRRGSEGFDLFGTVEDQVYGPVESERPLATRAVQSTRGEVALFHDAPIRANYSSTCGGMMAEVWEAWPTPPLDYLRAHRDRSDSTSEDFCRSSPHYRWREEWAIGEFVENVRRYGPQFGVPLPRGWPGEFHDVRPVTRSRSGRVRALSVTGTAGEVIIPAYVLRQVLRRPGNPAAILRSNLFKIAVRRDENGRPVSAVATGAGSGHGVGLCQSGALGMARAGNRAERIVAHYYSDVEVKRLYP